MTIVESIIVIACVLTLGIAYTALYIKYYIKYKLNIKR